MGLEFLSFPGVCEKKKSEFLGHWEETFTIPQAMVVQRVDDRCHPPE